MPNKQYFLLNPGENLQRNVENVRGIRNQVSGIALKTVETVIKYGAEVANSCDPLTAAVTISSKARAGASLSRFSASQCAGLVESLSHHLHLRYYIR